MAHSTVVRAQAARPVAPSWSVPQHAASWPLRAAARIPKSFAAAVAASAANDKFDVADKVFVRPDVEPEIEPRQRQQRLVEQRQDTFGVYSGRVPARAARSALEQASEFTNARLMQSWDSKPKRRFKFFGF